MRGHMEPVWLAVIVAVGALLTTVLTTSLNAWQIRKGKEQDYERQDAVADQLEKRQDAIQKQAAEAARLLEERQDAIQKKAEEAARLLIASNKLVAEQTREASNFTNGKLAQIHELVNSNLTSQMEESHAALTQQLVLMREIIQLHKESGRSVSDKANEAIRVIESRIDQLGSKLYGRAKATQIADSKLEVGS